MILLRFTRHNGSPVFLQIIKGNYRSIEAKTIQFITGLPIARELSKRLGIIRNNRSDADIESGFFKGKQQCI